MASYFGFPCRTLGYINLCFPSQPDPAFPLHPASNFVNSASFQLLHCPSHSPHQHASSRKSSKHCHLFLLQRLTAPALLCLFLLHALSCSSRTTSLSSCVNAFIHVKNEEVIYLSNSTAPRHTPLRPGHPRHLLLSFADRGTDLCLLLHPQASLGSAATDEGICSSSAFDVLNSRRLTLTDLDLDCWIPEPGLLDSRTPGLGHLDLDTLTGQ